MANAWRTQLFQHPSYIQDFDLVVANPGNELVGFCSGWQRQNLGQIEPLGVPPDYRGMGLGHALEIAMMDSMQRQNISLLYVDHGSTNEKAIALSRKLAFVITKLF